MSLLVKALLLLWPFLRVAIFGDRPVRGVLAENRHICVIFLMLLLSLGINYIALHSLEVVKSENTSLHNELVLMCPGNRDVLSERQKALSELLK